MREAKPHRYPSSRWLHAGQGGFTLIEVIISISILAVMTFAVSSMLRNGFDIRFALSQKSMVTHRLNNAMAHITEDLEHSFIISTKDTQRNVMMRERKPIFRIEAGDNDKLFVTTMDHAPLVANSHEPDTAVVVYELKPESEHSGRYDLYRGEYFYIPEDLKDPPPERVLARNIKGLHIHAWNGEDWAKDTWDSSRMEERNMLPHMVQVTIEAYADEPDDKDSSENADVVTYTSVAYLPMARGLEEPKHAPASVHWERL